MVAGFSVLTKQHHSSLFFTETMFLSPASVFNSCHNHEDLVQYVDHDR